MKEKSKFINAKIVDDKSNNSNKAKKIVVTYEEERKNGLYRRIVSIPIIFSDYAPIFNTISRDFSSLYEASVNLGFGSMKILSANEIEVKDILIKERVEELTIEDIEKELGYKIKIVDKKE